MYKRVKRVSARNGIPAATEESLQQEVYPRIVQLRDEIRQIKETSGKTPLFWGKVCELVYLKHRYCISMLRLGKDPVAVSGDADVVPRVVKPPCAKEKSDLQCVACTEIKLRWRLRGADGRVVRLQRPFQLRASISGQEVMDAIVAYTREKMPGAPTPVKFEVESSLLHAHMLSALTEKSSVSSSSSSSSSTSGEAGMEVEGKESEDMVEDDNENESESEKCFTAICGDDVFSLPLVFPGPKLCVEHTLNVRVTYPEGAEPVTEGAALPQVVDCATSVFGRPSERATKGARQQQQQEQEKEKAEEEAAAADRLLERDFERVALRAFAGGVSQLVLAATDLRSSRVAVSAARRHARSLFPAVGVHPRSSVPAPGDVVPELRALCAASGAVVAIGRIGIDPDAGGSVAAQTALFEAQLGLANELGLPVIVCEGRHGVGRQETVAALGRVPPVRGGIVLCDAAATGGGAPVEEYAKAGLCICVSGASAASVAGRVAAERLVLASNAPRDIPAGTAADVARNEPRTLPRVAAAAAKALGMPVEALAQVTAENARRVFGLPAVGFSGIRGEAAGSSNAFGLGDLPPAAPAQRALTDSEAKKFLREGEVLVRIAGRTFACEKDKQNALFKDIAGKDKEALLNRALSEKLRELIKRRRNRGGTPKGKKVRTRSPAVARARNMRFRGRRRRHIH